MSTDLITLVFKWFSTKNAEFLGIVQMPSSELRSRRLEVRPFPGTFFITSPHVLGGAFLSRHFAESSAAGNITLSFPRVCFASPLQSLHDLALGLGFVSGPGEVDPDQSADEIKSLFLPVGWQVMFEISSQDFPPGGRQGG